MVGTGAGVRAAARAVLEALKAEKGRECVVRYPDKSHEKAVKLSLYIRRSAGAPGIMNLEL